MELILPIGFLKIILPILAIIAGVFVITTKNAIISVFNLIVLYILVAFYLIYIGITYLGISYIVIYIGAIAILFLFVIMMIDIEVVEKRSNNYLPLLFLLLGGFFLVLKDIFYNIGLVKLKSFTINKVKKSIINDDLFNLNKDNLNIKLHEEENLLSSNKLFLSESVNRNENFNSFENSYNKNEIKDYVILNKEDNKETSILNIQSDKENILKSEIIADKEITSDWNFNIFFNDSIMFKYEEELQNYNYIVVIPNWDSAVNRITQISAIGDVLYTVYHSFIYIISVLLLLGMIGAIILTGDTGQEVKIIKKLTKNYNLNNSELYKKSSFFFPLPKIKNYCNYLMLSIFINNNIYSKILTFIRNLNIVSKEEKYNKIKSMSLFLPFIETSKYNNLYTEGILGNIFYFIFITLILALLLLFINSYFSLSVKYLDKGGGFECGFTSFVQTRERFNVIFYRVSLLFLVFDLEIILIFPYTAIYQKYQNISKNNVLAFLYILIVGFVYELKEGALNIVKKAHNNTEG